MRILKAALTLLALFIALVAQSQDEATINEKLGKLYQKGLIAKCEKKALAYKSDHPKALTPYYYLSKIEIYNYKQIINPPNKKQHIYINKAAKYSSKARSLYPEWAVQVQTKYIDYIYSWNDTSYTQQHVKSAIQAYEKVYKEELPIQGHFSTQTFFKSTHDATTIDISTKRQEIIDFASTLIGIEYKYAGTSPITGFDCSGFTQYVYKQVDINIPHSSDVQSKLEGQKLSLKKALPGDLVIFGSGNKNKWNTQHTAIIYENNNGIVKVIHSTSRGVSIDGNNPSWESYWKDRFLFVLRIPELD